MQSRTKWNWIYNIVQNFKSRSYPPGCSYDLTTLFITWNYTLLIAIKMYQALLQHLQLSWLHIISSVTPGWSWRPSLNHLKNEFTCGPLWQSELVYTPPLYNLKLLITSKATLTGLIVPTACFNWFSAPCFTKWQHFSTKCEVQWKVEIHIRIMPDC